MARFQLDPNKSAMENLYAAARIATATVMKRYNYYGLHGELRDDLFDEIMHRTVEHFVFVKVRRHTYAHTTKDGKRKLVFMDNVLSSSWSASAWTVNRFMAHLTNMSRTGDIDPIKFCLGNENRLPNYVSETEAAIKRNKAERQYAKLKRPCDRARRLQEAYQDYIMEAEELELCNVLSFDKWLGRNGYTAEDDPELFWHLLPYEDKVELRKLNRDIEYANLPKDEKHRRDYQREYARKRREKERAEMDRKLREVLGAPPEGYQWFEMKSGRVGQRKIKK